MTASEAVAAKPLLRVKGLHRRFGGLRAVDDVSFAVEKGSIHAVIGPNGAGKTTLLNCIGGALRVDAGHVLFRDRSVRNLKPHRVAARGVARTFQNIRLFHGMTVLENVMVGRHVRSRGGLLACFLDMPWTWRAERRIREAAMETLALCGIAELADADAASLAFGQQRAVELARALAGEPRLLLLDEPAAGLNLHETAELAGLIRTIRDTGVTVLLVEHDMSLVMEISDTVLVLNFGRKIAEGPPKAIQRDPEVIRVYLGGD